MGSQDDTEKLLAATAAPEVVEGPHKEALRRDLLRRLAASPVAGAGGMAMGSRRRRLAWACLLALIVAGTAWAAQKAVRAFKVHTELGEVTVSSREGPRTYRVSQSGTVVSDDPEFTQADAEREAREIRRLIAEGKCELVEVVDSAFGLKTYRCKVVLANGTEKTVGSSYPPGYSRSAGSMLQEVVNLMDAGKGKHVGVGDFEWGRLYWYNFTLSDGHLTAHAEMKPYLGGEEEAFDEIKALVGGGNGELLWGPDTGQGQSCYKVTLSDGRVMYYLTDMEL